MTKTRSIGTSRVMVQKETCRVGQCIEGCADQTTDIPQRCRLQFALSPGPHYAKRPDASERRGPNSAFEMCQEADTLQGHCQDRKIISGKCSRQAWRRLRPEDQAKDASCRG